MALKIKAFAVAFRGIGRGIASEFHLQLHVLVAVVVVLLAIILQAQVDDWCWLTVCIGAVLSAELFNTALEKLADRISPEYHPLVRDAKDMSAGAVLLICSVSATVGIIRFWPLILQAITLK